MIRPDRASKIVAFEPMPSSIYLYVTDCDKVYQQALENGGVSVFDVMDLPSGER